MSNHWSKSSRSRLGTCHPDLQKLFEAVLQKQDCSILCGHRGKDEQVQLYAEGKSQLLYPHSKHNQEPSLAVDAGPWINGRLTPWNDTEKWLTFAAIVFETAIELGIRVRWGGNWKSFKDMLHWELMHD